MTPQYIYINKFGTKFYFNDERMTTLHREDGPAVEYVTGYKAWWVDGIRHRTDGPAVEYGDDSGKAWYINGKLLTEEQFNKGVVNETILTMNEIAAKFGVDVKALRIIK